MWFGIVVYQRLLVYRLFASLNIMQYLRSVYTHLQNIDSSCLMCTVFTRTALLLLNDSNVYMNDGYVLILYQCGFSSPLK